MEETGFAGNKLELKDLPGDAAAGKYVFNLELVELEGPENTLKKFDASELEDSEEGGSAGNKLANVGLEDLQGGEAAA